MKAITTRYVGYTERFPARFTARDADGNNATVPSSSIESGRESDGHKAAAMALCAKMGWTHGESLIPGGIKGATVWVFPEVDCVELLKRVRPMLVQLGDYIGNGPIDTSRADSLGTRCDLIGDIDKAVRWMANAR